MSEPNPRPRMIISLNVLEHLGINLYSNVPSVLSEVVANAWDADADEVRITWERGTERGADRIVIQDDGSGMTPQEINERFLNVGYRRRDGQPGPTPKGRRPMGRKGIGKLSLFSISNTLEIETVKDGQKSAFLMRLDKIREMARRHGGVGTYEPEILPADGIDFRHGTRITLDHLRRRLTLRTTQALKKRVARRFSIIGERHGFRVFIDDREVSPSDRDYYDKIRYIWTYGDQKEILNLCKVPGKSDGPEEVDSRDSAVRNDSLTINGWLATVKEVKHLKDEDGDNLNRIAVFVRGKMAQEDMLSDFAERGVYASYLIGELRVDELDKYDGQDTDEDEDAATSSRQRIVEDDERYQTLREIIGRELKYIQGRWADLRTEEGTRKALEIPEVRDWVDELRPSVRRRAKRWLGKINRIRIDDIDEQKQMMKHAVLAFEFHRINENLDKLENIGDDNLQVALEIFSDLDNLESNLYGQIVQQRIQVIRTLQEKIDENALERVIQRYLFEHLWLLDPSWERAEGTEAMEKSVRTLFDEVDADLSDDEKGGRLDIKYRKTAGQHVIIELKRPERVVRILDVISNQIEKYYSGMRRILDRQDTPHEPVEIVLLLGKEPQEWNDGIRKEPALSSLRNYNARIVFYDKLLKDAYQAYSDYFNRRIVVDRLANVMRAIDDYAPENSAEAA